MQPTRVSYATSTARSLAVTQLVLGGLGIIAGIAVMVVYTPWWASTFTGAMEIWMPISFVVAGILGVVAASQSTTGIIVAHMVLSIIASVLACVLFIEGCIYSRLLGPHIAVAILSFAEFVISIISAAFCCRAVCCGNSAGHGMLLSGQPEGSTVVVTSGQPVVYQQHYVAQPGMQYAPAGQYMIQSGVHQQMAPHQYAYDQTPAEYPVQKPVQNP